MSINKRIKSLREQLKMTQEELARKTGYKTRSAINKIESGNRDINQSQIVDFAKALGVTPAYLMGWEDGQELVSKYNKQIANKVADEYYKVVKLPVYSSIACGEPCMVAENIASYEVTPKSWLNGGEYFYLIAKGDSMIGARIHEGDLLLIRKQPTVEEGEIAAVVIEDECTLKRVYHHNGTLVLQAENPKYAPIIIKKGNVRIIGKLNKVIIKYY